MGLHTQWEIALIKARSVLIEQLKKTLPTRCDPQGVATRSVRSQQLMDSLYAPAESWKSSKQYQY